MIKININDGWSFTKDCADPLSTKAADAIGLPHTWNAVDGTDGGDNYFRGCCRYQKTFACDERWQGKNVFVEFCGANLVAEVYLNGQAVGCHKGGYSRFVFDLTPFLREQNTLTVLCDNSYHDDVYPQKADFTFYGGIYRDVNLLVTERKHFAFDRGAVAVYATPTVLGDDAQVKVTAKTSDDTVVRFDINGEVKTVSTANKVAEAEFYIKNAHKWNGKQDPYLYKLTASITEDSATEKYETYFGIREFAAGKDGFTLNGKTYPLRGVSKHQDRAGVGNAVTAEMLREDFAILLESGANAVRLAHYQHDDLFYSLCDEYGIVVWAEVPYITEHLSKGDDNVAEQLSELVLQNYNHSSIAFWCLSNEITTSGGEREEIRATMRRLNDLCHSLDKTRLTVVANLFMLDTDSKLLDIPDLVGYNLYYGWYVGEVTQIAEWLDSFRAKRPDLKLCLSEYGADANIGVQVEKGVCGDYSESYQALYHETVLRELMRRDFVCASFAWNLFDFGADGRNEGNMAGINQKGLVTFDRKTKKDAFYAYKACCSSEPFVHICGKRCAKRGANTEIKVYSNQRELTLIVDGVAVETKECSLSAVFELQLNGRRHIRVEGGKAFDQAYFEQGEAEIEKTGGAVKNWFDEDYNADCYSIKDSIGALQRSKQASQLLQGIMQAVTQSYGALAANIKVEGSMRTMMENMTLEQLFMRVGKNVPKEEVAKINAALQKIKK